MTTGKNPKERKIDLSLQEVTKQLEEMEANYAKFSQSMPSPMRKLEERIQSLHKEMDDISDKMLSYKLQRLATSKMLESVGAKKTALADLEEMAASDDEASPIVAPSKQQRSTPKRRDKQVPENYQSSTFKCKSDLDRCLLGSKSALDKALCFTLFIRCVVKG